MNYDLVDYLLQQYKASLEIVRRKNIEERLNIYNDYWKAILKREVDEQFSKKTRDNVKQMIDDSSNVLKRIVKEISKVYKKPAQRSYVVNEKEDEVYKDILTGIPINIIMQENNRLTNLNNENLIYIVWRNKRIEYDLLTANLVEVYQSENDPTQAEAIVFDRTFVDTKGNTNIFYIYYDIYGNHFKLNKDLIKVKIEGNEKNINPYKDPENPGKTILPFLIFHKDYPIESIWNTTGGEDLVSGTKQIGVLLTYLNYLMKVNSFKMPYFIGIDIKDLPNDLVLDPLFPKVIKDSAGKIGTLDMSINLEELWGIIYNKIGALANNYGLSLDNFKLSANAQSGYALKIKNIGLEDVIEEQKKQLRWGEKGLFEKTKIVNNTMSKKKIKEKGLFRLDFAETEYPENPENIRKQWKFDIAMGSKSVFDYVRFVNPDIKTNEQAEALLRSNNEINERIKSELDISVDKLLETAFKEQPLIK